jgi:hypothetical protein
MASRAALQLALDRVFQVANKDLSHASLLCYHDSKEVRAAQDIDIPCWGAHLGSAASLSDEGSQQ